MGDNATKSWEWHNNIVGKGYQARGVIRQPGRNDRTELNIVDMSKPVEESHTNLAQSTDKIQSESPKEKDKKSSKKKRRREADSDDGVLLQNSNFNPLLQVLAKRLSNKTMEFC